MRADLKLKFVCTEGVKLARQILEAIEQLKLNFY
jgi:hypothetical protein